MALTLGVTGDDAAELLDSFSSNFGVDISEFEFQSYFGGEASVPISLMLVELFTKKPTNTFKRLEVKDLVKAIELGKLV